MRKLSRMMKHKEWIIIALKTISYIAMLILGELGIASGAINNIIN